jgi:hypothetical protein
MTVSALVQVSVLMIIRVLSNFRVPFTIYCSLLLAFVPFTAAGQRENHLDGSLLFPGIQPMKLEILIIEYQSHHLL